MKNKIKFSIFLITASVLLLFVVAPLVGMSVVSAKEKSTIARIDVSDLNNKEIRAKLEEAIDAWTDNPPSIEGGGVSMKVDTSKLVFNIDATIRQYEKLSKKPWYAFWAKKDPVHISLQVRGLESVKQQIQKAGVWDVDETYNLVVQQITNLQSEPVEAVVTDNSKLEQERLAFAVEKIPESAQGVYDIARFLDGKVIGPDENFSLLNTLGNIASNANTEGLSFVASLIYHNVLSTNSTITERYSQKIIPSYLEPGVEALVDMVTKKDLSFTNKTTLPILMKCTVSNQRLKLEFYSSAKVNAVNYNVVKNGEVNPKEIIRYTNDLSAGQVRILQQGKKGVRVTVYRNISGFEEQISRDYYPPINQILVKSSRTLASGGSDTTSTTQATGEDVLDLNNDGLPDIIQGVGHEQKVDKNGNVILEEGMTINKAGQVVKE